mgnify:CR=1 FL=1
MKYYRYEIVQYADHDIDWELTSPEFPNPTIVCREYNLIKKTPKGFWIGMGDIKFKWIPSQSKRKFAYPTKKEALNDFISRTEKRMKILSWQLKLCEICWSRAKLLLKDNVNL